MSRSIRLLTTPLSLSLAATALLLASAVPSRADMPVGSKGLGIILGEPTGFSAAYILRPGGTLDAAFAYSYIGQEDWQVHADYLFTGYKLFENAPAGLDEYFGIGGRWKFESSTRIGVRIPGGVNYQIDSTSPFQFFGEIVPIVDIAPNLSLRGDFSVGVRYFF